MNTQYNFTAAGYLTALLLLFVFAASCSQDIAGTTDNSVQSAAVTTTANAEGGVDCDPGSFSADGLTPCEPCPPGTYQDLAGQTFCKPAPTGSFVDKAGSIEATLCPVGKYQNLEGQTSCKDAEPGSFVAVEGSSQSTECPVGKYQPEFGQISCIDAPEGSFVAVTGAAEATLCPISTFSDVTGASECTACDAGFTTTGPGATSCILKTDPTSKDDCKKGKWETFDFKNQGQCVRFVETGKDSR